MPAFSNTNDMTAITAIRVNILFFLIKSIMLINNLFIKFISKNKESLKSSYRLRKK